MKQDEFNLSFSLESIEFLFRHPWLFLCPAVIIFSIMFAFVYHAKLNYKSSAVLSLESAGQVISDKTGQLEIEQKRRDLIGKALLGNNIDMITKEVWPELNERADPVKYSKRVNLLRDPKIGIVIKSEREGRLLHISFQNPDPKICYKVVQAAINTIIGENKKEMETKIEAGLSFLSSQVEFYKDKLKKIDDEMLPIKADLSKEVPKLSPAERDLVRSLIGEAVTRESLQAESPALQKSLKYNEIITGLSLELLEAQKKKERLLEQIEKGTYSMPSASSKSLADDFLIQEYNKAIAAKEIEITRALSAGYMPEHPAIKTIQKEITDMKAAKENRIQELTGQAGEISVSAKKETEQAARDELANLQFHIEALQGKINLIQEYSKNAEAQLKKPEIKDSLISQKVAKLMELQNEKTISTKYYADLTKQLEEMKLKSRLEKEKAGFNITVAEAPEVPLNPIPFQKIPKILMGLMIALGVGGGLTYAVDSLDNPIRSSSELRELLQIPVLATIDRISTLSEIRYKQTRRNTILIALAIFAILSNIIIALMMKS